jgi:hypothetical protein
MAKNCLGLLALAFCAVLAPRARAADSGNAELKVTFVVPAAIDSFQDVTLKVILSQSTPSQTPGITTYKPVDSTESSKVSHTKGTESKEELTVGSKVKLDPNLKYVAIAQIWANGKIKGIARSDGKPSVPVLTSGGPSAVTFTVSRILP